MHVEIKNLKKFYKKKGNYFAAIDNLNLDIASGEITSLIGPNGAGKTTLIKNICGLVTIDSGVILIDGHSINKDKALPSKHIGVVLEGARNLYNFLTVEGNIRYFSYLNHLGEQDISKKTTYYLDLFQLSDKRNEPVNNLSRGMQQKVAIILALLKDPPILILDEPTLGLDIESSISISNLLKRMCIVEKKTIFITSHKLDFVQKLSDKVAILDKGKIIACDSPSNLSQVLKVAEKYEMLVLKDDNTEWLTFFEQLEDGIGTLVKDDKYSFVVQLKDYDQFIDKWISKLKVHKMERISHSLDKIFLNIVERGVK